MKANVLQVLWHEKEQVLSCDFEPSGKGRLATAGGDSAVRVRTALDLDLYLESTTLAQVSWARHLFYFPRSGSSPTAANPRSSTFLRLCLVMKKP